MGRPTPKPPLLPGTKYPEAWEREDRFIDMFGVFITFTSIIAGIIAPLLLVGT